MNADSIKYTFRFLVVTGSTFLLLFWPFLLFCIVMQLSFSLKSYSDASYFLKLIGIILIPFFILYCLIFLYRARAVALLYKLGQKSIYARRHQEYHPLDSCCSSDAKVIVDITKSSTFLLISLDDSPVPFVFVAEAGKAKEINLKSGKHRICVYLEQGGFKYESYRAECEIVLNCGDTVRMVYIPPKRCNFGFSLREQAQLRAIQ